MKFSAGRARLDSMIVEIEYTLVSIIQGVALYVLFDCSRDLPSPHHAMLWPYVFSGLFIILIFWSRSVLHIITLIRWPFELGHNFLYVALALAESYLFVRIEDPEKWFVFSAAYALMGWVIFAYDLRLIRQRQEEVTTNTEKALYDIVALDQLRNIWFLVPALVGLNAISAYAIYARPDFFITHNGHVWLGIIQAVSFGGYLLYVRQFYKRLAPLILQAQQDWHGET